MCQKSLVLVWAFVSPRLLGSVLGNCSVHMKSLWDPVQLIDVVEMRCFGEITDDDLNNDPLVVLGCGHACTISTLDGIMELENFYERGAASGG